MKMADILHSIADMLDQHSEEERASAGNMEKSADDFQHEVGEVDHNDDSNSTTMVPPLQQKLELLKKASGVPNMFDDGDKPDELDDIKKLTGITAVMHGDDEPVGE
jgi:hypothetical protein